MNGVAEPSFASKLRMTVEQPLDTLSQDDPNLPSLPYQAYENVPIHLVWTRKPVQLATGFDSTLATRPDPLQNTPLISKQSEEGVAAACSEHLDLKGTV
ncbi:hypothetical protein B0H13DRAFT_2364335 [Mycena leptocephala]|nr:hypothetical protein B0H13DRAFT_2364335 [Mycena leptocephala]